MSIGYGTFAYRRDLPHLVKNGKTYFVTFCTVGRSVLPDGARDVVLECCVHDHELTYWLHCAVVMPDHVHLLFTPYEEWSLAKITHRLKSVSAHRINAKLGRRGAVWQHESFDHILRSDESIRAKSEYICNNPVRAGLVASPDEYRWLWREWVEGQPKDAAGVGGATQSRDSGAT